MGGCKAHGPAPSLPGIMQELYAFCDEVRVNACRVWATPLGLPFTPHVQMKFNSSPGRKPSAEPLP